MSLFLCLCCFANLSYGQLLFADQASSLGVAYSFGDSFHGCGVSFVDFDQDGKDDLTYATTAGEETYFFKNTGNGFNKIQLQGITHTYETKQVLWVDYDNDGDLDFFATSVESPNKLYQNDGSMVFTDVSATCGLFTENLNTFGASFGDIDNDGDLDVFISNRGLDPQERNYLYRNDNGVFVDITVAAGINISPEQSFCAAFFDYDNDGDQDIYVANDKYVNQNRFYKNNGDGTFEDVSSATGTDVSIDAMSTTIGDYNNDGWFDIYVTNTSAGNYLFRNNGDGTFTNDAGPSGTSFNSIAWGAVFLDADNDTKLDLYVSGSLDGTGAYPSSAFFHNNGDHTFSIPTNIGIDNDNRRSFSNAIGDIDNDGDPDIVVMNELENYYLWENQSFTNNNWVKIKLESTTGNRNGIGSRIEVVAGGVTQYRYTLCGEGYLSQNSFSEFIGIGAATNIESIKVTWNHSNEVETFSNVQANQTITLQEGSGVLHIGEQNMVNDQISVFPNPSENGLFTFDTNKSIESNVSIYDLSGRHILDTYVSESSKEIDLSSYAKGMYIAKVTYNNTLVTLKLLHR